jgi:hypothetical protein
VRAVDGRAVKRYIALISLLFVAGRSDASYELAGFLPGDAVDPYSDLSAYSFSIPHGLKSFGFSVIPSYNYVSHSDTGNEINRNNVAAKIFAFVQFSQLRLGVVSDASGFAVGDQNESLSTNSKLMASYLFSFISFGIEAGGMRSSLDAPRDSWGAMGALTSSVYFYKWAIDAAARFFKPNSSLAATSVWPPSLYSDSYVDRFADSQLYSLRIRGDVSYHWRTVLAGNYLNASNASIQTLSNLWRYRSGFLQVITGLNFHNIVFENTPVFSGANQSRINLPVYLILEHSRSLFYIGAASQLYSQSGDTRTFQLALEPKVAYTYRFKPDFWLNLAVASQSLSIGDRVAPPRYYKEIRASFQISYNLAAFGYDDEVVLGENLQMAAR